MGSREREGGGVEFVLRGHNPFPPRAWRSTCLKVIVVLVVVLFVFVVIH